MSDAPATPTIEEDPAVEEGAEETAPDIIELSLGRALDIAGAEQVVAARTTHLIVIAGPVDCGKTTLLTSIYESFQYGGFGGCQFVASETLPGFEQRCFLARASSGRDEAETARTRIDDAAFLHLRVSVDAAPTSFVDVLLTDLSGETFRQARDLSDECKRLDFLPRADHVALLIDGQKLASPRTRWTATQDCLAIAQALLDNQMLDATAHVEVLFSKWDFVLAAPDFSDVEAHIEATVKQFRERFATRVGRLRFVKVAARPRPESGLSFAHGLAEVFNDWLTTSPWLRSADLTMRVNGKRESERFLTRKLGLPAGTP